MKNLFLATFLLSVVSLVNCSDVNNNQYELIGDGFTNEIALPAGALEGENPLAQHLENGYKVVAAKAGQAAEKAIQAKEAVLNKVGYAKKSTEEKSSFFDKAKNTAQKAWNADVCGYKGAGKYAIVTAGTVVVLAGAYDYSLITEESADNDIVG